MLEYHTCYNLKTVSFLAWWKCMFNRSCTNWILFGMGWKKINPWFYYYILWQSVPTEYFTSKTARFGKLTLLIVLLQFNVNCWCYCIVQICSYCWNRKLELDETELFWFHWCNWEWFKPVKAKAEAKSMLIIKEGFFSTLISHRCQRNANVFHTRLPLDY